MGKWNPPLPFPFLAIGCVLLLRSNRAKQHPLPLPLPTPARAERPTGPRRRPIDLSIDRLIQSIDRQGAAGGRGAGQSPSVGVSLPRTSALLPVICVPSMSSSSSSPGVQQSLCVATRLSGSRATCGSSVETADSSCPGVLLSLPRRAWPPAGRGRGPRLPRVPWAPLGGPPRPGPPARLPGATLWRRAPRGLPRRWLQGCCRFVVPQPDSMLACCDGNKGPRRP